MVQTIRIGAGVALLLAGLITTVPPARAEEPAPRLRIGMVQGMFRDIQPQVVQAMSIPLRDLIRKQTGLTGNVEIVPDPFTLAERMRTKQYQLGAYHGFEFAWVRKQNPNLIPLVVTVPPGRKLQACVVVQKDNPATRLADVETVMIHRGMKAHCLAYLERQRLSEAPGLKTKTAVTAEDALEAVLAGDTPAALVDISALTGYRALQPGAFEQLRILCQSEMFPQTVIAYTKGALSAEDLASVRVLLTEAHTSPAGKPLMMLWNLKGFEEVPADYEAQLERISKAYPPPTRPASVRPTTGAEAEEK